MDEDREASVPTNLTTKFDELLQKGENLRERMKKAEEMLKASQERSQFLEDTTSSKEPYLLQLSNDKTFKEKRQTLLKDTVDIEVMENIENRSNKKERIVDELIQAIGSNDKIILEEKKVVVKEVV